MSIPVAIFGNARKRRNCLLQLVCSLGECSCTGSQKRFRSVLPHYQSTSGQPPHREPSFSHAKFRTRISEIIYITLLWFTRLIGRLLAASISQTSQECQWFIKLHGIYIPTVVPHGITNAVMYLQATLAALIPEELWRNILWWLNDIFALSRTVLDHLSAVSLLLSFCTKYQFKLHPRKCTVFRATITGAVVEYRLVGSNLIYVVCTDFEEWRNRIEGQTFSSLFGHCSG